MHLNNEKPKFNVCAYCFCFINLFSVGCVIWFIQYDSAEESHINTISPTPTVSPEPKKAIVEVIVQPWYGVIDLANGYGIEVEPSNTDELLFSEDEISLRINVMLEEWVI